MATYNAEQQSVGSTAPIDTLEKGDVAGAFQPIGNVRKYKMRNATGTETWINTTGDLTGAPFGVTVAIVVSTWGAG
jgi:hypothetical protein